MKSCIAAFLLLSWMIITFLLSITIIGLIVVCDEGWGDIPTKLIKVIVE